jgi:hypothetical protein
MSAMSNNSDARKTHSQSDNQTQNPRSAIEQEYAAQVSLFEAQSIMVQNFIQAQARQLAEEVVQGSAQMRFTFPDRVFDVDKRTSHQVPSGVREQMAGGLFGQLTRSDPRIILRHRLAELESSSNRGTAISTALIRYATSAHMIYNMLPSGRTVSYLTIEGEEIPSMPITDELEPATALTASTDAIVEQETGVEGGDEEGRGELLVPYVPFARRFYIPKWIAIDDQDHLLVGSVSEAEANVSSMQRFLFILHTAVGLAPYMVADEIYQQKRYGMLGQLVNQGRALARFQTGEIIQIIHQRAKAQDLNRGLSLSLPYFDDQSLEIRLHEIEIIPAGRIMFVPAFVVRATNEAQAKVAQDTRMSPSTRKHLLAELATLEKAFLR